jgi:hypothetical protein
MKNNPVVRALGHAVLTFIYISLVALFMSNVERVFDNIPDVLAGMTMLTLFVVSAAVTGALVVGRPILLYIEGKKSEAVRFFGYTLGWLVVILVLLVTIFIR